MSTLFSPIQLGNLTLDNRIIIPPMCQYSANEGQANSWHMIHYGHLSLSCAGLLIVEATAVEPAGRISNKDLGLWDDQTEAALAKTISEIKLHAKMPLAIQIAHAGRKASMPVPWLAEQALTPDEEGWQTVAPSAIAFDKNYTLPEALTQERIESIIQAFINTAERADRIGFDAVEIHAAHGYLLHQFLSPLANVRKDQYGGSLENRMRLTLEILQSVRAVFPKHKTVGVRISATDWVAGGWDLTQSIELAQALKKGGADYIHVSTGGLAIEQQIAVGPNYQVSFAEQIKKAVDMPTIAVGLITEPEQAEAIVATKQADMVALGRGMLFDPRWPWHAAAKLGAQVAAPLQYRQSVPHRFKGLFK